MHRQPPLSISRTPRFQAPPWLQLKLAAESRQSESQRRPQAPEPSAEEGRTHSPGSAPPSLACYFLA